MLKAFSIFLLIGLIGGCSQTDLVKKPIFVSVETPVTSLKELPAKSENYLEVQDHLVALSDSGFGTLIPTTTTEKGPVQVDGMVRVRLKTRAVLDTTIGPFKSLRVEYTYPPGRFSLLAQRNPDSISLQVPVIGESSNKSKSEFVTPFVIGVGSGLLLSLVTILFFRRS